MRRWRGLIKLNTTQHLGSGTIESYSGTVAKFKLDNEMLAANNLVAKEPCTMQYFTPLSIGEL